MYMKVYIYVWLYNILYLSCYTIKILMYNNTGDHIGNVFIGGATLEVLCVCVCVCVCSRAHARACVSVSSVYSISL